MEGELVMGLVDVREAGLIERHLSQETRSMSVTGVGEYGQML